MLLIVLFAWRSLLARPSFRRWRISWPRLMSAWRVSLGMAVIALIMVALAEKRAHPGR